MRTRNRIFLTAAALIIGIASPSFAQVGGQNGGQGSGCQTCGNHTPSSKHLKHYKKTFKKAFKHKHKQGGIGNNGPDKPGQGNGGPQ
jgi:hypothetical protein